MALNFQPAGLHGHGHLGAQVLIVVSGRHREVTFLVTRPIAQVVLRASGIPAALFSINEIETLIFFLVKTHVIEDEELSFRAEESCVRSEERRVGKECRCRWWTDQ